MNWTPKLVKQGRHGNCGQCCVAMITHLPVDIVNAQIGHRRGTSNSDMEGLLRWFGLDSGLYSRCDSWIDLRRRCDLAVVHSRNHWVVYFKGLVWDTHYEQPTPIGKYRHRIKGFIPVETPS